MFSVVCWKWEPLQGYRSKFAAENVNILRNMVERHFHHPHEFVCITDNPKGIDPRVRIVPLWDDHARVHSPHGGLNPSCYRRLKLFSATQQVVGERFVSVDLDVVLTGDVTPLWTRKEDFVIWGDQVKSTPYNGSMWMMHTGARRQVWDEFDPEKSPALAHAARYLGSDQAWISYCLGSREAKWTIADGVYSFRTDIRRHRYQLPKGARIVFFQGHVDPWMPVAKLQCPWIEEHYR